MSVSGSDPSNFCVQLCVGGYRTNLRFVSLSCKEAEDEIVNDGESMIRYALYVYCCSVFQVRLSHESQRRKPESLMKVTKIGSWKVHLVQSCASIHSCNGRFSPTSGEFSCRIELRKRTSMLKLRVGITFIKCGNAFKERNNSDSLLRIRVP